MAPTHGIICETLRVHDQEVADAKTSSSLLVFILGFPQKIQAFTDYSSIGSSHVNPPYLQTLHPPPSWGTQIPLFGPVAVTIWPSDSWFTTFSDMYGSMGLKRWFQTKNNASLAVNFNKTDFTVICISSPHDEHLGTPVEFVWYISFQFRVPVLLSYDSASWIFGYLKVCHGRNPHRPHFQTKTLRLLVDPYDLSYRTMSFSHQTTRSLEEFVETTVSYVVLTEKNIPRPLRKSERRPRR